MSVKSGVTTPTSSTVASSVSPSKSAASESTTPTVHHYIAHAILDIVRCYGPINLENILAQLLAIGQCKKSEPKKVAKLCQEIIDWEICVLNSAGELSLVTQGLSALQLEALHNKLWTAEMQKRCPARAPKPLPVLVAKAKA